MMKGRSVLALSVRLDHAHVWVLARIPGVLALRCERCRALVEVLIDDLPNGDVRFRFRCLAGTDHLVSDAEFPQLARWLGLLDSEALYAGRLRSAVPGPGGSRRRRSPVRPA